MDSKAVRDALITRITALMESDYTGLVVTGSLEDGLMALEDGDPFIALTIDDSSHTPAPCKEDEWRFLVNMDAGPKAYAQSTPTAAQDANAQMGARFRERFNGDANYAALKAVLIYKGECKTWPESQRDASMTNPHLISCSTY